MTKIIADSLKDDAVEIQRCKDTSVEKDSSSKPVARESSNKNTSSVHSSLVEQEEDVLMKFESEYKMNFWKLKFHYLKKKFIKIDY